MNQETVSNNNQIESGSNDDYVIDLLDVARKLWSGKLLILSITTLAAILSVFIVLQLPVIYKSQALLAPTSDSSTNSSFLSQYEGLASIAGVSLDRAPDNQVALAAAEIKSYKFFKDNLYNNIIHELSAVKGWDGEKKELIFDADIYDSEASTWLVSKPSPQEAFRSFGGLFNYSKNKLTGMVTVSVEHSSPEVAKKWVDLIVEKINSVTREREIQSTTKALTYYEQQRNSASLRVVKEMFDRLSEEQYKNLMLANVEEEYVFQTIDPAIVSERRDRPNRGLFCIVFTFIGGIFSVIIALIKDHVLLFFRSLKT
jgi:LPS O-antigen subunit length determinant protein (WzzB/FepE family)